MPAVHPLTVSTSRTPLRFSAAVRTGGYGSFSLPIGNDSCAAWFNSAPRPGRRPLLKSACLLSSPAHEKAPALASRGSHGGAARYSPRRSSAGKKRRVCNRANAGSRREYAAARVRLVASPRLRVLKHRPLAQPIRCRSGPVSRASHRAGWSCPARSAVEKPRWRKRGEDGRREPAGRNMLGGLGRLTF
jgi:hypothetical protein